MENPQHGIRLRSSARTSTGQVRENNEDNIHLWTRDDFVLAIVADGMGGAAAGEEASRIAVETIRVGLSLREGQAPDSADKIEDSTLTDRLRAAIQLANVSIVEKAATSPEMRGMGTTVTMAFVRGTYAIVAHVGDSRAYLVDGEDRTITQITSDHSFVEALLAAGHITPEQAMEHPMRNVLYRALGQAEDVDVDMYYKRLHIGDRLVLCSDGLTRHVLPDEIARLALSDDNPDVASQKLIDLANERGGEDNVSVIIVSVEGSMASLSPERAAALLEADEDETLVLANRPRTTLPEIDNLPQAEEAEPQQTVMPPKPVIEETPTLDDDPKMHAERLKDILDDSLFADELITDDNAFIGDDTIDRALASRPDGLESVATETPPLEVQREGQVEGRDTLLPDQ